MPQAEHNKSPAPTDASDILVVEFVCAVAGTSFDTDGVSRASFIKNKVNHGDLATLQPEPDNPHDTNAIAVHAHGFKIGYLRRSVAERHAESANDPALYALANVRRIERHIPPGVFLNFALYAQRQAVDEGLIKISNGRVRRTPIKAQHLGRTSAEWMDLDPDNLEALAGCCKAELALFKSRPLADISPPFGRVFVRACILARKQKRYELEVKLCKAWLAIASKHDSDRLVVSGDRARLAGAGPHKNIAGRLVKAAQLLESQQTTAKP